jgi:hypothetical protein
VEDQTPRIRLEEFRSEARVVANDVLGARDPRAAVEELSKLGMRWATSWAFASCIWNVWGGIREELTAPGGDPVEGAALARECALDLLEAVGEEGLERDYCAQWMEGRLGAVE